MLIMANSIIHLVRHGQSEWNAAGRMQGHSNSDLTELGRRQATAAGRALARRPLTALYASDLDRAQQTAALIQAQTGHPISTDARLRETGFGVLEGLTWPEIEARHPEAYAAFRAGRYEYVIEGGESRAQTLKRGLEVLSAIADHHSGEEVAAITHGGLMGYFFRHVVGIPLETPSKFHTANAAISSFERKEGGWKLITWGAADHLAGIEGD